jgi:hypothetical protein
MRTLAALLITLPLVAAAQNAPPPEVPPAAPIAQPPPPPPPGYQPGYQPAQPPPPAFAPRSTWRDSWYIGFGVGSGGGNVTFNGVSESMGMGLSSPTKVFINFKVGATLTPNLLLGLDIAGFRVDGNALGATVGEQISTYSAMVTWFPMERGFFLRGGAGLSNFRVDLVGFGGTGSADVDGVNLTVGAGYAFWIGRSFNLTVNLDVSGQSYRSSDPGAPSKSNYTALWLGFDWY